MLNFPGHNHHDKISSKILISFKLLRYWDPFLVIYLQGEGPKFKPDFCRPLPTFYVHREITIN